MEDVESSFRAEGGKKTAGKKKKAKEIACFLFLSLLLLTAVFLMHCKFVNLVEGEEEKGFYTFSTTVEQFLMEQGIQWEEEDLLIPPLEENIRHGDTVYIRRAVPVTLSVEGKSYDIRTQARTVTDLLVEEGVYLYDNDLVMPAPGSELSAGEHIEVIRSDREYVVEREEIPYSTVRLTSSLLESGQVRVLQDGRAGVREKIIELTKRGEEELSRKVISSSVVEEPEEKILEYGGGTPYSRGKEQLQFQSAFDVEVTAYCPGTPGSGCPIDSRGASHCTGFHNDGYTFTGLKAVAGDGSMDNPHIVAVDPRIIPLQSLLFIEGYGFAVAEDTGGVIKGNKIDLLFDDHADAKRFGRKQLRIYLIE